MNLSYKNKSIEGILTIIPQKEVSFEDEMHNYNFPIEKSRKLKLAMGYDKHCIVEDNVCSSDLVVFGLEYLFKNNLLNKDELDALVVVTQTPDYIMPPTSNVVQGRLGLKTDMICLDINQGCSGYIIGLIQAFMLLDQPEIKKVAVLNVDVLSKKVSRQDRNSFPLTGDGASVTIVVNSDENKIINGFIKMDGTSYDSLIIPAGGSKLPSSAETGILDEDKAGNFRSLDNLVMKGDEVFLFVQKEVPLMIDELMEASAFTKNDVDYFMFHQPNRFMLQKLAEKMKIPFEKMPNNIVANFGNSSGVTIPTNISFNLGAKLENSMQKICMAGFGVGLTWASLLMDVGNLRYNKIIRY